MKKACVIGWPIAHSRSPLIHNYWLKQFSIDGSYERIPVEPRTLAEFFARIRGGEIAGCNVTSPHKEAVAPFLDRLLPQAADTGSVNTIYWDKGELVGTSTDGEGFANSVASHLPGFSWQGKKVLVLGAGGSARAIIAGLLPRGARSIAIWNRTEARAHDLSQHFGSRTNTVTWDHITDAAEASDVIINTTTAGLAGASPLVFPFARIPKGKVIADIVYVPLLTDFLKDAKAAGHSIVPGLGMLLHQAVPGFEKWFGRRPEVTAELYDLVARDIARDTAS